LWPAQEIGIIGALLITLIICLGIALVEP